MFVIIVFEAAGVVLVAVEGCRANGGNKKVRCGGLGGSPLWMRGVYGRFGTSLSWLTHYSVVPIRVILYVNNSKI